MSKQIKIGFDKVPAPITKQFTQLVDIEGTKLFDSAGNPLVTEEETALTAFTSSESSLSVHVNNKPLDGGAIPVVEQFPLESEVSSSLLGVPRAEEQLSLFSDVATYGLDEDQWNAYVHTDSVHPVEWYKKKNPLHGRRENPSFNEGSTEQALYLKAFPSQYTFPTGTRERRLTSPDNMMISYMNFIALGRFLYNKFINIDENFTKAYFLDPDSANVVDSSESLVSYNFDISGTSGVFTGNGDFFDVVYGAPTLQDSFDSIEAWTFFFDQIKAGTAVFPAIPGSPVAFESTKEYRFITQFATFECKPGAGSRTRRLAILESKRAFRYQPGRASGFTFGSRMASEPTTTSNFLEWGCSNDTDEYMFQLRGSQFNIVRRSTIKMPEELLTRQGLSVDDQSSEAKYPVGIGNTTKMWETVIPRSKWNGDGLFGTGPSGYILSFEDVTMYKIEYSWYGAIGAKFYAYIPIGNGECRWVLLHTFVIENGLGEPVLANPDFKFKYLAYIDDSQNLQSPIYLYKYGSSYYVDGGDEGTIRLSTTTTPTKFFQNRTPILGILPKNYIRSSTGEETRNYKKSYPSKVTVNTSATCRIDIEEIVGSPNGVHFNYAPSISSGNLHPKTRLIPMKFVNSQTLQIRQGDGATGLFPTTVPGAISVTAGSATVTGSSTTDLNVFKTAALSGISLDLGGNTYEVVYCDTSTSGAHTLTITPEYVGTDLTDVDINLVYRLNPNDNNSHVIANGVYGVYVNSTYSSNGRSSNILRRDPDQKNYNLISSDVRDMLKVDKSVVTADSGYEFVAKLQNYNTIFASKTPVYANKFKIHFLNPSAKSSINVGEANAEDLVSGKHFSEFIVTLSPNEPIEPGSSDSDDEVMFQLPGGTYEYFDKDNYPFIEYCHQRVNYGQKERAERYEWDPSYGDQMSVDPRLDRPENRIQGVSGSTGYQSAVQVDISVDTFQIDTIAVETDSSSPFFNKKKVTFSEGVFGPSNSLIKFDSAGNPQSEIGVNFKSTGKFFESQIFRPTGEQAYFYTTADSVNGTTIEADTAAEADADGNEFIQTKNLTLSDDWQAESYDENGDELYTDNQFAKSQAVTFNAQPLYPVFALQDNSRVNGIVIEEINEDGTVKTHCPEFIKESSSYNSGAQIINIEGATSAFSPNAFNSEERLASCQYDVASSNPLRPGNLLYSFYVSPGKPVQIDLENVFNVDRKGVSRGLLNNKAIFFNATSITPGQNPGITTGNVELTVTVKEQ